jgi:hypothetical protein
LEYGVALPAHLREQNMHLDPDFDYLTYGDQGERAKFGLALALVLPPFLYCLPSHIEFADSRVLQAISRRLAQCM